MIRVQPLLRAPLFAVPILAFLMVNAFTQSFYSHRSLTLSTDTEANFVEVPRVSSDRIIDKISQISATVPKSTKMIVSDTSNVVLAKIFGAYFTQTGLTFESTDYYSMGTFYPETIPILMPLRDKRIEKIAANLSSRRIATFVRAEFPVLNPLRGEPKVDPFYSETRALDYPTSQVSYLIDGPTQSVFNRRDFDQPTIDFVLKPYAAVKNHVVFVDSDYGHSYVFGMDPESFFQLEPDYFYRDIQMVGMGRFLLLRVDNPAPKVRIALWLTASLKADNEARVPPVKLIGARRVTFHGIGRGSARLISDPVEPLKLGHANYVLIDMGIDGVRFKRSLPGLARLFHTDIPLDHRKLVAFGRDVSALDARDFETLQVPSSFHGDEVGLSNKNLFYSGVYEDGWVSEESSYRLTATKANSDLRVFGFVPLISDSSFKSHYQLYIDGRLAKADTVEVGAFGITVSDIPAGVHDVLLKFSAAQRLPDGDGRPVVGRFCNVAFVDKDTPGSSDDQC